MNELGVTGGAGFGESVLILLQIVCMCLKTVTVKPVFWASLSS